jgi:hypothetical protein
MYGISYKKCPNEAPGGQIHKCNYLLGAQELYKYMFLKHPQYSFDARDVVNLTLREQLFK